MKTYFNTLTLLTTLCCLNTSCKNHHTPNNQQTTTQEPSDQGRNLKFFFDNSDISIEGQYYITNTNHSTTLTSAASNASFLVSGTKVEFTASSEFQQAFIDVLVDSQLVYRALKLEQKPSTIDVNLGDTPNDHNHLVEIYNRGEGGTAATRLIQLETEQPIIKLPKPNRRLMFIGASVTCGAIAEPYDNCVTDQASQNGRVAHGTLIAHALNAESQLVCRSGKGILNGSTETIPQNAEHFIDYTLTSPNGSIYWDHRQYTPDGIVISLGNNDNLGNSDLFISSYNTLLYKLRSLYPAAIILLTEGPLISGDRKTTLTSDLKLIVDTASDNNIRYVPSKKYPNSPCDGHPDTKTHKEIAEELLPLIKENLNW